jgi:hypothetical protein
MKRRPTRRTIFHFDPNNQRGGGFGCPRSHNNNEDKEEENDFSPARLRAVGPSHPDASRAGLRVQPVLVEGFGAGEGAEIEVEGGRLWPRIAAGGATPEHLIQMKLETNNEDTSGSDSCAPNCSALVGLHDALAEADARRMEAHGGGLTCAHYGGEIDAYRNAIKILRDSDDMRLIRRISDLNHIAGEIGPGILRQIVHEARYIAWKWDDACPDCAGETFTDERRLLQCRECGWISQPNV